MSTQRVISAHFPYLPVHVEVVNQTHQLEALLDTGFDGDIAVPPRLITGRGYPDGYHRWILADTSRVAAPFYAGTLRLGAIGPFDIYVTALGDEPIIGRGLIDRLTITLDHGHQVIAEP